MKKQNIKAITVREIIQVTSPETKKMSGGKRYNSGRKKVEDKKIQICSYIKKSVIERNGGVKLVRGKIKEFVENLS